MKTDLPARRNDDGRRGILVEGGACGLGDSWVNNRSPKKGFDL